MSTRVKRICTALATAAALAAPAAAQAGQYETAKFKVTVEGKQQIEWAATDPDMGSCDVTSLETGSEKVRFSSRPTTISAFRAPGDKLVTFVAGKGLPRFKAKARVTRDSDLTLGPSTPGEECPGGGGTGAPIPPDCGTKTVDPYMIGFGYDSELGKRINLFGGDAEDPFRNCPGAGANGFPYLLGEFTDGARRKLPDFPASEVFDEEIGKEILIGRASRTVSDPGFSLEGKMQWEMTFRRLGGKG